MGLESRVAQTSFGNFQGSCRGDSNPVFVRIVSNVGVISTNFVHATVRLGHCCLLLVHRQSVV